MGRAADLASGETVVQEFRADRLTYWKSHLIMACLLYTSDAADERSSVDLGGRRIIKKKNIVYDYDGL